MQSKESFDLSRILSMPEDKRERVINAAMKEFCKGFRNASTDVIAANAGVSKGLLFHYFGTKAGLYRYTVSYALDKMSSKYINLINTSKQDLLERIWQMAQLKREISYQYPDLFEFMTYAYINSYGDESDPFTKQLKPIMENAFAAVYGNADSGLFKEGVDPAMAVNIVRWTLEGYSKSIQLQDRSYEEIQQEYDRYLAETRKYLELLKALLYRAEQ